MSSAMSFARMVHILALAIPCFLPFLSGCEPESYPPEMTYPLRADPIVTSPPGATRWDTTAPGQFDKHIAHFSDPEIGGKTLDPAKLKPEDRRNLELALTEFFGTPAAPTVQAKDAEDDVKNQITALKLDKDTLAEGSKAYRRHCMHCHGVTGDGRGPTGPWINPTPRDYRQGLFKFMSSDVKVNNRKPRREDLHRTLDHGIEGTSMPSFGLLEEKQKEALVSYIIHLSLRGECERYTMEPILDGSGLEEGSVREHVVALLGGFLSAWDNSNAKGIEPDAYPYKENDADQLQASVRRGFKLFTDTTDAGCISCHVDFGRQAPFRYDKWGTLVRPANLTAGIYRGGRRPIDLYWRIRGGIDPSQMPRSKFDLDQNDERSKARWRNGADPYWDLVNFVQALPYPKMLPEDIRNSVYGSRPAKATEHVRR